MYIQIIFTYYYRMGENARNNRLIILLSLHIRKINAATITLNFVRIGEGRPTE